MHSERESVIENSVSEYESIVGFDIQGDSSEILQEAQARGDVNPPVCVAWKNVNVLAKTKKGFFHKGHDDKWILEDVMGIANSGELIALMGASGAGKTTLLNVLTQRNLGKLQITGDVRINGTKVDKKIMRNISAYVQQEDLFMGTLTVKEHLTFQAFLRLPNSSYSKAQKLRRVSEVIKELGLWKCRNTKIGLPGYFKGISGGETKRLAFACAVLTNPSVLLCDEPTSGLDSYLAENVISVLQRLAEKGRTVICTIHQPPSEVYAMFNKIVLLAEGRLVFTGTPQAALKFFERNGCPCPSDYNPADFYIQTLAIVPGEELVSRQTLQLLYSAFEKSDESAILKDQIEKESLCASNNEFHKLLDRGIFCACAALDYHQFSTSQNCAHKTFPKADADINVAIYRPFQTYVPIRYYIFLMLLFLIDVQCRRLDLGFTFSVLGIFVGLLYAKTKLNQEGIMSINGALYFTINEVTFPALYGLLMFTSFWLDGFLFLTIIYFWIGLRPDALAFFTAMGITLLIEQSAVAFSSMISSMSPNLAIAMSIASPFTILLTMVGGLYSNVATLPPYISWTQYISWFRYGYEAYSINQWSGIDTISCESNQSSCVTTGSEVLKMLSFNEEFLPKITMYFAGVFADGLSTNAAFNILLSYNWIYNLMDKSEKS